MNQIWRRRQPLVRLMEAIGKGQATIGFLGGSITDARPGHNWPEKVMAWLANQYPDVRFIVENAAIGATGSDSAVFRAKRDITARNCDLVFVEYAVNDYYTAPEQRKKTREGLLRQLLSWGQADVVLAYTYIQAMYEAMHKDEMPDSIAEFEQLGDYYGISSVWMGLYAFEEIKSGAMGWEEWLPDGLHPTHRGSLSYAQSVIRFLRSELPPGAPPPSLIESVESSRALLAKDGQGHPSPSIISTSTAAPTVGALAVLTGSAANIATPVGNVEIAANMAAPTGNVECTAAISANVGNAAVANANISDLKPLPEPLEPLQWGEVSLLPLSDVEWEGPWTIQRSSTLVWIDQMLVTSAVGAKLRFSFEGRGLAFGFDFGKLASEFRYRLDGGEPVDVVRDRQEWCTNEGWFRFTTLSDEWEPGRHKIEIEVTHGDRPECTGTRFRLGYIGVIH